MSWFRRLVCLTRLGHDYHTRFENNWTFLECARCGRRTVGWHLDVAHHYLKAPAETLRLTFADDVELQSPALSPSPVLGRFVSRLALSKEGRSRLPPTPPRLRLDITST